MRAPPPVRPQPLVSQPGGDGAAQPRYDEVMGCEMAKAMTRPGDMLLGRRTWQDFTAAWDAGPTATRSPRA
jgi:hypothetical protein